MKYFLIASFFLLESFASGGLYIHGERRKVLRVDVENEHQIQTIRKLEDENKINIWNYPETGSAMFSVSSIYLDEVELQLSLDGMIPVTAIEDLHSAILKEREENQPKPFERLKLTPFTSKLSIVDWGRYHKLHEIYNILKDVASERHTLATLIEIGKSYENQSISGLKITSGQQDNKPVVFLECGIHAREWISPATCLYIINQLTSDDSPDTKELLDKYEWYIIPSTNPDGYRYSHSEDVKYVREWRKTRSANKDPYSQRVCYGVDANRNFPGKNFCREGSNRDPCDRERYCGPVPFSEKETQALRDITQQLGERLRIYFSIHSFGQWWMYPYGYTHDPAPNAEQLKSLSEIGVKAIEEVHGTHFTPNQISHIPLIGVVDGSSVDWVYDSGTELAFALELRPIDREGGGFMLPPDKIIPTGNETWSGIKAVVNAI